MIISGHTFLYGVVGNPVRHSLSPTIHNLWIEQNNIDARYLAFPLTSENAQFDFQALHRFGVEGLNVTMPFKDDALASAIDVSHRAKLIGASNTLIRKQDGWFADNSDADGFIAALKYKLDVKSLQGQRVLLLGAGGAARAAAYALANEDVHLTIANRTVSKAESMASILAPDAEIYGLAGLSDLMDAADIVANATSLGYEGSDAVKMPDGNGKLFYELSYGSAGEKITRIAQNAGWQTEDGLRMLVEQAAVSFKLWHGVQPDVESAHQLCLSKINS